MGETTRPVGNNLNYIPYQYTVELMSRFKGLDLATRVLEELGTEVCNIVQKAANKTMPRKRNARRQSGCLRRLYT